MTEDNRSQQRDNNGRFVRGNTVGFPPGQSGNPGGRVQDPGITPLQIEMLDTECPYASDKTWRQWLAERGLVLAAEKEAALEHLKERLEGKVADTHKIEGDIPVTLIRESVRENNTKGG